MTGQDHETPGVLGSPDVLVSATVGLTEAVVQCAEDYRLLKLLHSTPFS